MFAQLFNAFPNNYKLFTKASLITLNKETQIQPNHQTNIANVSTNWHHDPSNKMHWDGYNIVSVTSLTKIHNINVIIRQTQIEWHSRNILLIIFKKVKVKKERER